MDVERTERLNRTEVCWPSVVLVEHPGRAVIDGEQGVAERPIRRRPQRMHHQPQPALPDHLVVGDGAESGKPKLFQLLSKFWEWKVWQQDRRGPGYVLGKQGGIIMILVQMGHVKVIHVAVPVPVQPAVVRKDEP